MYNVYICCTCGSDGHAVGDVKAPSQTSDHGSSGTNASPSNVAGL